MEETCKCTYFYISIFFCFIYSVLIFCHNRIILNIIIFWSIMILQRYLRINVEKRYRVQSESLLRIKMQGGGGEESVFFRIYQQFQSDLSESCTLFLVRLTFCQLVKDRARGGLPLRWNGKAGIIMNRTRRMWPYPSQGMLARRCRSIVARSALIGSSEPDAVRPGMHARDTSNVSVCMKHTRGSRYHSVVSRGYVSCEISRK